MNPTRHFLLAAAAVMALATQAPAATIDFSSAGTGAAGAVDGGPLSYKTSAFSTVFPATAAVSVTGSGLGIRHFLDTQPSQIDGTLTTQEVLTVTFSWAVNLISFTLGRVDRFDDFELAFNGGAFTAYAPGFTNPVPGQNNVTSFSIRASGSNVLDLDNFTLRSAEVAPVPLPAAGFLMLAGLAGLAGLRRRKTA